jgi:tetratricopeptide (TPR) repeat protein
LRKKSAGENMLKLLIIILSPFLLFASAAEDLFKEGNELYRSNEFAQAIEKYELVAAQNYISAELFYNLGNAYFREGMLGYAILNYEKAIKLSPSDEDIKHNLQYAYSRTIDKTESLPKFFIFEWWEGFLSIFSVSGWSITAYIIFLILLTSAGFYFFTKRLLFQRVSFYSGIVTFFLLIFTIGIITVKLKREMNVYYAVVVETRINAKQAPDEKSQNAFLIHEGLKLRLEERVENWAKIRLQDGKVGWVPLHTVKII